MPVARPQIRFTYEDYKSLPESMDKRYELLDGELVMVPAPTTRHQMVSRNLEYILHGHVRAHRLGTVLYAPVDLVFGSGNQREVLQPDILFVSQARRAIVKLEEVQGAPDLVVEILSPATAVRDRGYKKALYGRHGVREYWIVDPETETVQIHLFDDAAAPRVSVVAAPIPLHTDLLPGLAVDLAEVFYLE
mgnify:CR=1 FL=1